MESTAYWNNAVLFYVLYVEQLNILLEIIRNLFQINFDKSNCWFCGCGFGIMLPLSPLLPFFEKVV